MDTLSEINVYVCMYVCRITVGTCRVVFVLFVLLDFSCIVRVRAPGFSFRLLFDLGLSARHKSIHSCIRNWLH